MRDKADKKYTNKQNNLLFRFESDTYPNGVTSSHQMMTSRTFASFSPFQVGVSPSLAVRKLADSLTGIKLFPRRGRHFKNPSCKI